MASRDFVGTRSRTSSQGHFRVDTQSNVSASRWAERRTSHAGASSAGSVAPSLPPVSRIVIGRAPTGEAITMDTESWLRGMPHTVVQYTTRFARHGYETVFAVGLMEESDLTMMGIGEEHAAVIANRFLGPRNLVSRWTPLLESIPTTLSLAAWLRRLPVDLSVYVNVLMEHGFDTVAVVRHVTSQDALTMGLRDGHVKVLLQCTMAMGDLHQRAIEVAETTIEDFLFRTNPPLDHYSKAVRLSGAQTVLDLLQYSWDDVDGILMRLGHKRLLFHYIVACRAHWVDHL
jgi:hypothetical protein